MLSIKALSAVLLAMPVLFSKGLAETTQQRETLSCPETLSILEEVSAPVGWITLPSAQDRTLDRVDLLAGHPDDKAVLVPDQTRIENEKSIDAWSLANVQEQVWIICHYRDTGVRLAQELPQGVSLCEARYRMIGDGIRTGFENLTCLPEL